VRRVQGCRACKGGKGRRKAPAREFEVAVRFFLNQLAALGRGTDRRGCLPEKRGRGGVELGALPPPRRRQVALGHVQSPGCWVGSCLAGGGCSLASLEFFDVLFKSCEGRGAVYGFVGSMETLGKGRIPNRRGPLKLIRLQTQGQG